MHGMTDWSVVKDLKNNIMYYRGQSFLGIRKVEINRTSNDRAEYITLEDTFESTVDDVTDKLSEYKPMARKTEL